MVQCSLHTEFRSVHGRARPSTVTSFRLSAASHSCSRQRHSVARPSAFALDASIRNYVSTFRAFLLSFLSLKSPVCLISKDMRGKYRKVEVKVQKDTRKTNSKRQSNDTFPDVPGLDGHPFEFLYSAEACATSCDHSHPLYLHADPLED